MIKGRQIFLVMCAGVLALGSAAITVGARTIPEPTKSAISPNVHTRSAAHRDHRRRSSGKSPKRLPKAKSLKKESW